MTSGVKFFTAGLTSQLDNNRIVPQLVLRVDMSTQDQFDIDTPQPGWKLRLYRWEIPAWLIGRPCVIFCSLPNQGYEVYGSGFHIAYQDGQPFAAPVIYVFALDYVTYSNSDHGMRLWMDNGGPLVYDSGNFHLNIRKSAVVSIDTSTGGEFLNYPTGGTNSFPLGLPQGTAISIPYIEIFRDWGVRFGDSGSFRANALCRWINGSLQTKMFTIESELISPGNANSSYDHLHVGNGAAVPVMFIDRNMYD
jgi:hypothetical protein